MLDVCFTVKFESFTLSAKFVLETNGVIAVIGPSGSGKSSLLNTLAGYSKIKEGQIAWNGELIQNKKPSERPIATLFQDNNLFPHLTIQRNLALVLTHWPWLNSNNKKVIHEALRLTGIAKLENKLPFKLSGGQRSRAALARIFIQDRPILLLDEPFSALGPAQKNQMLDLVAKIAKEKNLLVLLVTHDPKDALRIAPKTIPVVNGLVSEAIDTSVALNKNLSPLRKYLS